MDSKFVFDLGTVDLSDGHAAMATLAGDDAPMPLETAAWAPELAGPLGFPSFTVLDMRGAIRRGDLRPERHGHRILVSRRQLQEWRDRCRVPVNPPASGSKTAEASGASSTPARNTDSTALALQIAARLKNASRAT
jgi:hypothetical protein